MKKEPLPEPKYPSAELAYPLAVASYDTAQKRLDAVEKRLQEILAFVVTITFAVITIYSGKNINFQSRLFSTAMIFCFLGLVLGFYARLSKHIILIKPKILFDQYLTNQPEIFQKDFIYFAGQHWDRNLEIINFKGKLSNIAVALFFAEFILLGFWVVLAQAAASNP